MRTWLSIQSFFLKWSDLGPTVFGKEIIQRLGEQILDSRVTLGRGKPQLLLDLSRKVASDVAFPFPARPKMKCKYSPHPVVTSRWK